jgi:hypothetical protein
MNHTTTEGVDSFDFVGCSVNFTGNAYPLAQVAVSSVDQFGVVHRNNRTVIAAMEGMNNARMIVSGTNFIFDNWGVGGHYQSDDNDRFTLQMAYWLISVI